MEDGNDSGGRAATRGGTRAPQGPESSRARALAAMAEAVGELGYADTTVGDVLKRARMSRRTFYRHFDNREACFLAAYDEALDEALAPISAGEDPGSAEPEQLACVLEALLGYLAERPELARLLVVEAASAGPSGLERHESTMRELADRLARAHAATAARGDAVSVRCEAGVGAVHRVLHARIVDGRAHELPALVPELVRVLRELGPAR